MLLFVYEDVTATASASTPPSLLAEGRAMLNAVVTDFRAIPNVDIITIPDDGEFHAIAGRADYSLVIAPETNGRLESLCQAVLNAGGRLLGPQPEAIRISADKLGMASLWHERGIRTPSTWPIDSKTDVIVSESDGESYVIKPRDGAGSLAMRLSHQREIEPWTGPMIAQALVEGIPASVSFVIGESFFVPLLACEQLLSNDGRFRYLGGRLPIAPHLAERAITIASAAVRSTPGMRGYVGVDIILGHDRTDWAIEINPRLTTSYVGLRSLAEFNIAEAILLAVSLNRVPAPKWLPGMITFGPNGSIIEPCESR